MGVALPVNSSLCTLIEEAFHRMDGLRGDDVCWSGSAEGGE